MFSKIILLIGFIAIASGFPNGAPADTCVRERANEPNHGAARSQTLESIPYQVIATTDSFQPGSQIQGL